MTTRDSSDAGWSVGHSSGSSPTTFSTSTGTCFAGSVCGARRSAELNLLAESAELVTGGSSRGLSPDPGDEPFCASAESGRADFIVTLNPSDFPQDRLSAKVIAPGDPLPGGRPRSR
jgi:hypothetical protein